MSFLYKRLAKLAEIAAKKEKEKNYDFSGVSSEQLNHMRTISAEQQKTNK
jgi:hypothetical protein